MKETCKKLLNKGFSPLLTIKDYHNKSFEKRKYTKENHICKIEDYKPKYKVTGFSLITGLESGIMVLDLDRHEGQANGIEVFKELIKDFSQEDKEVIKSTFTVKTPHNGLHLYFKYKEGLKTKPNVYDGIDIRTDGGLICTPYSIRDNNKIYDPVDFNRKILEMPESLYDILYIKCYENKNNLEVQSTNINIKYKPTNSSNSTKVKKGYKINYKILGEIIKNNISVIDILQEYYGINARNVRGNIPCPVHGGKNNNFAIYENTNTCYCFSKCSNAYNPISLVMECTGLDYKETLLEVANRFNIDKSEYMDPIEHIEKDKSKIIELDYENYVSEKIEEIKQTIDDNKNILINAPTGGGKTKVVIDLMHKYSDDINILLTPNVIQNKQNAKAYKIQAFTGSDKNIHSNFISATFDKSAKLKELLKGRSENINLYVDECHLLVDASNYRMKAINDILDLTQIATKIVYMSATTDYIRDVIEYNKELYIKPQKARNNISSAQLLLLPPQNIEGSLLNHIIGYSNTQDRKTILFYDNIEKLKMFKDILLKKGFKDNEIALINSKDKTINDEKVFNDIIELSNIPIETKILLTTSVLEVGTNINTNNVNIFVYIPKSNHLNTNKIVQEVARFRATNNQVTNNILKICMPKRDKKENIRFFSRINNELRTIAEERIKYILSGLESIYNDSSKQEKEEFIKGILNAPKSLYSLTDTYSMGIIELDEEKNIPVINEYKLQKKSIQIFESQYFYNPDELVKILEDKLNVDVWLDIVNLENDNLKEEIKELEKDKKDLKKKTTDYIKEIFTEIKQKNLEELFEVKVIDPEINMPISLIEDNYDKFKESNIIRLTKQALDMQIKITDIVNSFSINGDSIVKNRKQFIYYDYLKLNKKYPINSICNFNTELYKDKDYKEYKICRQLFDEVCRKQGKLTKSKKLALLLELLENKILQGYIIKNGAVYKQSKKKSSDTTLKPLISKDIDKLINSLVKSIYNVTTNKENKEIISSLKKLY